MTAAELMQTALALAWHDEFLCEELTIWMEGHGREGLFADLNVSRTVGWFTSLYPVKFRLEAVHGEKEKRLAILRRLKEVPHRGSGYGVLAYSLKQFTPAAPQIVFNYLGEISHQEEGVFRILNETSGPDVAPENHFPFLLEINAIVMEKQLQIELIYSPVSLNAERMERLVYGYQSRLLNLAQDQEHLSGGEIILTPEDFDAVNLTQQELDSLFK
jgi:non-ribosomal peptide synthase protein (TIGR01720 family)